MKRICFLILSALLCAALLAGCGPQAAVEQPSPTPVETAPASEAPTAEPTAEPETEVDFVLGGLYHLSDPSVAALPPTFISSKEEFRSLLYGEPIGEVYYFFGVITGRYYFQSEASVQGRAEVAEKLAAEPDWQPNAWLWLETEGDGVKVERVLLGRDGFTVEVSAYTAPGEEPAATWGILLHLNLPELPPAETPVAVRVIPNATLRDLEFRAEERIRIHLGAEDRLQVVRSVAELPDDLAEEEQFNEDFFQTHSLLCTQMEYGHVVNGKRIERVRIAEDGTVFIYLVMNVGELVSETMDNIGYAIIVEKLPENAKAIVMGENRPKRSDLTWADIRAYNIEIWSSVYGEQEPGE